jgi:uncharacterized protein (TIGR02594 family)
MANKYSFLKTEKAPAIFVEALKHIGTKEIVGKDHNKKILAWAKEIGWHEVYVNDEIPWCGLFIAYCAKMAGVQVVKNPLRALAWNDYGTTVKPGEEMLGDILTFSRSGGGHVGIYVGEDSTHFHVLGGNQNNEVNIVRIKKERLAGGRRTAWKKSRPLNVRKIFLDDSGIVTENEA